jgi:hypothetical protein
MLAMERETTAIWARYGVRFAWPSSRSAAACDRTNGSFDVLIDRYIRPTGERASRLVLGRTYLEPAAVDHAPIRIDLRAIEQTLSDASRFQLLELAHHSVPDSSDLGRALGRVLAHEIGHVLLAFNGHGTHGLMRRSYTPGDLISLSRPLLTLSAGEVDRLRARERVLAAGIPALSRGTSD